MSSLEQLALIWAGVFAAVFLAHRTRLTPVLFYLAIGSAFVNLGLLPREDDPFIRGFADIGLILIMFALGFEENAARFVASIKRSWGIAFFGALAPFLAAYGIVFAFWRDFNMALISGLAMTATAVSLTMVSLKSEKLERTDAATGIMTSAVLDDIASLALVAIMLPIASGDVAPSLSDISWIVFKAIAFFVLIAGLAAFVLPRELAFVSKRLGLSSPFGFRTAIQFNGGRHAVLAVLLMALVMGLIAHLFGFHPAVGAYMAGLILKEEYFEHNGERAGAGFENVRRIVDNVAFSWIGPVFFVSLGAKIVFDRDLLVSVIPQTAALVAALIFAQTISAGLAARYTGRFPWPDSILIGFGMLGRAELCFVVLDIAFVQNRIITEEVFYTLMLTAFWLNVAVPISIAWWKPYYAGEKTAPLLGGSGPSGTPPAGGAA
ncbi:MAG: cation:proton antiporter [Parvularculaceae bacterium]